MVRLIRCIIDECGVSRSGIVYDDPATDCISQSFENANAEISNYTFKIILEFALNRKRQDHGALSHGFAFSKGKLILYPNLVFLTPICLLFSEILLNFVQKSKRCRLWQQNSIL